ncbi:MAG TPA: DNA polymerase III subunit delta [bacterium]|nr:DNA polymerase III subunit delta [bacterium]
MIKLYHGQNNFLTRKKMVQDLESMLTKIVVRIDCELESTEKIYESYQNLDLFEPRKTVILRNLSKSKEFDSIFDDLEEMLNNSVSDGDLPIDIIIYENSSLRSNSRLLKLISQHGEIYASPKLNKQSIINEIKRLLDEQKINLDNSIIYELADRADYDIERVATEISKLTLLKSKSVNLDTLTKITTNTHKNEIWDLTDSINKDDREKTVKILDLLLTQRVDPYYILAMIMRNLRQIMLTKLLLAESKNKAEICKIAQIPPFTFGQVKKKSDGTTIEKLEYLYEKINNLEYEMKIGKISPELGLTLLSTVL